MTVTKLEAGTIADDLSAFERAVLDRIGTDNEEIREALSDLLPGIRVNRRELTGVGAYIHFDCETAADELGDRHFGLCGPISIPNVEYGLTTELACSGGKPSFLELCTTGSEAWHGNLDGYSFFEG